MPAFSHVADLMVFPLLNPHTLQLGTVGSRSTVNYGTESWVVFSGVDQTIYLNVVNFDHYNIIIGTPFMWDNKVLLNFESSRVIINGVATPATPVEENDTNECVCQHRTTNKHKE